MSANIKAPAPATISTLPSFPAKGSVFVTIPRLGLQTLLPSGLLHSIVSPKPFRRKALEAT